MRILASLLLPLAAVAILVAGCTQPATAPLQGTPAGRLVRVQDRAQEPFAVDGYFSHTLQPGAYKVPELGLSVDVPASLPATAGADGATGRAATNLGLFLPIIPGCDWSAKDLGAQCKVPVVADAGPYYAGSTGRPELQDGSVGGIVGEGDTVATVPAHRLGKFLIDNMVPHGYAVAQVSVLGTGDSGSCQDLMGPAEQAGIDAAVTWLGSQSWSNGNVALIGRSYDGSTPWEAATTGNPHLKTIVPISGLTGVHELMYHNGTSETRGAGELDAIYAAMTVDGEAADATQVACPDYALGVPEGLGSVVTGGNNANPANPYWTDRYFFARALQNYKGSVYVIHGLQDFNVDPHMAVPLLPQIQATWATKALLGQWNHMYPDRPSEHVSTPSGYGHEAYPASVRYDWAQDLLEWFDHYLKGTGPQPDLHVEVQDNHGAWRIETNYPPTDATTTAVDLADTTRTGDGLVKPTAGFGTAPAVDTPTLYDAKPLATDLRIAGLVHLPLQVTPLGSGGQVFAQLRDVAPDGTTLRLGHAVMDLRYAQGDGTTQPVVPGLPTTLKMEFEALDATVPAGHHLQLALTATGEDYLPSTTSAPVQIDGGQLLLPTLPMAHGIPFTPPAWSGNAEATPAQP